MQIKHIFKLLLFSFLGIHFTAKSQFSNYYENKNYEIVKAINLTDDQAYSPAQFTINEILNYQKPKDYILKKILLDKLIVDLSLYEKFALSKYFEYYEKYPNEEIDPDLYKPLANYYLAYDDYENAIIYLEKIGVNEMSKKDQIRHEFKLGYVYFMNEQYSKALPHLFIVNKAGEYKEETNYMIGISLYQEKRFSEVMTYFEPLLSIEEYAKKVRPYLIQIYYNNQQYESAISEGKTLIDSENYSDTNAEISKIIGESYFKLKEYSKATSYLQTYLDAQESPSSVDYYQIGYVYYIQKQYSKAVEYFNKIINENSEMGQNAYYQLGNSYLQSGNKNEALTAYKSASEMNFSTQVAENAFYNYAKLSFEIGNPFESPSLVIQKFITKYPKNPNKKQMDRLLIKSYLKTNNYSEALKIIKSQKDNSPETLEILQQVSYLKATELFHQNNYSEAIIYFNEAIKNNSNKEIYAKSLFWLAESNFKLEKYTESLEQLKILEKSNISYSEKNQLNYSLGYSYFKTKEYQKAQYYFTEYLKNPKLELKSDAELRLADSYISLGEYQKAQEIYTEQFSNKENDSEYLDFQKGILFGLTKNNKLKITTLEKFLVTYPKSEKTDQVYLELAYAYYEENKYEQALNYYDKIVSYKFQTEYQPLASLGKADCYAQLGQTERAIREYQNTAKKYEKTEYVKRSIEGAKPLYLKLGKTKDFEKWLKEIGYSLSNEEKEDFTLDIAQNYFDQKKYDETILELTDFESKYPKSTHNLYTNYLIGESYYQLNKTDKTIFYLTKVAGKSNDNQEDALFRLSQTYLNINKNSEALLSLEALNQITKNENYKNFSERELMIIYAKNNQFDYAEKMANSVVNNSTNSIEIQDKAKAILARSKFYSKKESEAKELYKKLELSKNQSVKAESLFFKAYFLNQDKKYKSSNEIIFDLASKFSSEQYWGAKGLVLMANNYYNLKDIYQANFTIDQVLNNYQEFKDVIFDAKELKNKIK